MVHHRGRSAIAEGILAAQNGLISDIEHMADAIVAARSLTIEFVDENEEVGKRLEGEGVK